LRVGTLLLVGVCFAPTRAAAYQGQVLDVDPGNQRLRMAVQPAAVYWGRGTSLGSGLSLAVGLTPNVWVTAQGFAAWPMSGNYVDQYYGEAGMSFVRNALRHSSEGFTLDSSSYVIGDYRVTQSSGVQVPTLERHLIGARVGARFFQGFAHATPVGTTSSTRVSVDRLDLYVGAQFVRSVHTSVYVQGYGVRTKSRWSTVGLDLLIAPWSDFGVPVQDEGNLLGGRVAGTFAWGGAYGLALTYEVGYAPNQSGWYLTCGIGLGIAAGSFDRARAPRGQGGGRRPVK